MLGESDATNQATFSNPGAHLLRNQAQLRRTHCQLMFITTNHSAGDPG